VDGGAPHGYALSAADRRLLRSAPPAATLRWCAAAIGRGARVVRAVALAGGNSSAVHAVDVEDARGTVHPLVLRRFVRADWLAEEPDLAHHEAAALELMAGRALPTPRLVAIDAEAAVPAVLMTRLDGAVEWHPAELEPYLARLAAVLPEIHATPVPPGGPIGDYAPYPLHADRPPDWSRRPDVWDRAFDVFHGPPPAHETRFIHRDFHPGNVLWADGAVSGVVDWPNASRGSPCADVGHCRLNLAWELGQAAADRFLALCDVDYHPYWDVVAALGGFEASDWSAADEDLLAAAVAQL
jgi:aminoglycoside phosphotransferase (APT) family kinase protein